jgi:hypothetical protein
MKMFPFDLEGLKKRNDPSLLSKKIRSMRRKEKKAEKTLIEVPNIQEIHRNKLDVLNKMKPKVIGIEKLLIELQTSIDKGFINLTNRYYLIFYRVIGEFTYLSKDVNKIIMEYVGRIDYITDDEFIDNHFMEHVNMQIPLTLLIHDYTICESRHERVYRRWIKMTFKKQSFENEVIKASSDVEYARKKVFVSQTKQDNAIYYIINQHIPNAITSEIMRYLGNKTRQSSSMRWKNGNDADNSKGIYKKK